MINEQQQKELALKMVDIILNYEKEYISKLVRPAKSKVIDQITKRFDEEYKAYDNN